MKVKIYAGLVRRIIYGRKLKKMNFYLQKDEGGKYYRKHYDDNDKEGIKHIRKFCRHRFLRCVLCDDSMERSTTYRANFFKSDKGIFGGGKYYFCAYCGRVLSKRKVAVDHIIPVALANSSLRYRKMLTVRGVKTVNDVRNLTASCFKCNSKKGSSGGLWIIRGYFGKSWIRVMLKEVILLLFGGITLYYLYNFLYDMGIYNFVLEKISAGG